MMERLSIIQLERVTLRANNIANRLIFLSNKMHSPHPHPLLGTSPPQRQPKRKNPTIRPSCLE